MGGPNRSGCSPLQPLGFQVWTDRTGLDRLFGPHSHLHFCPHLQPLVLSAYVGARGKHLGLRLSEMVPFPGRTRTTNWGINCCISYSGSKSDQKDACMQCLSSLQVTMILRRSVGAKEEEPVLIRSLNSGVESLPASQTQAPMKAAFLVPLLIDIRYRLILFLLVITRILSVRHSIL